MNVQHKDATITNTDEEFPGSFEVILSAPTKDRDGETLLPEEWKQPLPDHITFDADHGMTVATTVGSGGPRLTTEPMKDAKGKDVPIGSMVVSGTYSSLPRAQEVRTLVNEGHIRTTSVAFMSEKSTKDGGKSTKVTRELLNGAFVAIPSNREALVLASKSAGVKAGARNSATDMEHLQAIHDHASAMGADCAKKSVTTAEVKSIVGSLEATQDRARDALEDQYGQRLGWLRGVLPDVLIFDLVDPVEYDTDTYRQSYTDDGAVITLTGSAEPVDVAEIVTPDADASREETTLDFAAPAVKAAAPQSNDDAEQIALRAHALALMATCLASSSEGD